VPLPQLFLFRCKQPPVVERVRLLDYTDKGCGLALAYVLADFTHLSQSAAKIVAPVAKIELSADVNHISLAQFWDVTSSAGILNFSESDFADASGFLVIEDTPGFDAPMLFRHVIFHDRKSSTPLKRGGTEETR
jgi:hypothetical protein